MEKSISGKYLTSANEWDGSIMRRPETHCTDEVEILKVLMEADVGSLGIMTADGYPRVIPVDFVAEGTTVYFHGAMKGEKSELLAQSPKVTFSVYIPFSVIPSYWMAEENALGATHFYKSVQINGSAVVVDDIKEKAHALQILMEKYQPEGRFKTVTAEEELYEVVLRKTLIVRIAPELVTAKFKFGQSFTEKTLKELVSQLERRAEGTDLATAAEIRRGL